MFDDAHRRSRSPRRRDCVWVHRKNRKAIPIAVNQLEEPRLAMSVVKAAKKEMELTIATDRLALFTDSTCSQPINDTTPVDDIRGGTHEAPLLIHYDEADAPPAPGSKLFVV